MSALRSGLGVFELLNAARQAITIVQRTRGDALEINFHCIPGLVVGPVLGSVIQT